MMQNNNDKIVEEKLPEFVDAVNSIADEIILHHIAFNDDECELFGMAIKYACKRFKTINIVGDERV